MTSQGTAYTAYNDVQEAQQRISAEKLAEQFPALRVELDAALAHMETERPRARWRKRLEMLRALHSFERTLGALSAAFAIDLDDQVQRVQGLRSKVEQALAVTA